MSQVKMGPVVGPWFRDYFTLTENIDKQCPLADGKECIICHEEAGSDSEDCHLTTLPCCGQLIGNYCLEIWILAEGGKRTCPNCRAYLYDGPTLRDCPIWIKMNEVLYMAETGKLSWNLEYQGPDAAHWMVDEEDLDLLARYWDNSLDMWGPSTPREVGQTFMYYVPLDTDPDIEEPPWDEEQPQPSPIATYATHGIHWGNYPTLKYVQEQRDMGTEVLAQKVNTLAESLGLDLDCANRDGLRKLMRIMVEKSQRRPPPIVWRHLAISYMQAVVLQSGISHVYGLEWDGEYSVYLRRPD